MSLTPRKISLIQQTETVLLEGMRTGRWRHSLPGERSLSAELRISRWTLRAAFSELARQGMLEISHGRACLITTRALESSRSKKTGQRVALLSPFPLSQLRQYVVVWIDELKTIFHHQGIELTLLDSAKAYHSKPGHALKTLVENHPHDAWLLLLSTQPMQQWFETAGLPAVIAGSRYASVQIPSIDVDQSATGVHVGRTVHGFGHRRIALLQPKSAAAGIVASETGLRNALRVAQLPPENLLLASVGELKTDVCRALDRLLALSAPPTVLITARAGLTLTALSHLHNRGLRVPQDMSIVAIEWEPFLANVVPDIAHYELSPLQYARRAARAITHKLGSHAFNDASFVVPEFIRGGSLSRPSTPPPARERTRGAG